MFKTAPARANDHCQPGIEFSRPLKGANGFFVIECVDLGKALIEKLLRFGFVSGNRMMMRTHARNYGRGLFRSRFHLHVCVLRKDCACRDN